MIEPICDNILAEYEVMEEKTKGGLFIPTTSQEKSSFAKVIAVGPGRLMSDGKIKPLSVKAGDRVLLNNYGGREKKIDGKMYLFLKEEEILAVIKEDEEKLCGGCCENCNCDNEDK